MLNLKLPNIILEEIEKIKIDYYEKKYVVGKSNKKLYDNTNTFINIKCKAAYIDCNLTSLQHHKSLDEAIKPGLVVKDVF